MPDPTVIEVLIAGPQGPPGPGSAQDIATTASPTFAGITLSGLAAAGILWAGVGGAVSAVPAQAANLVYAGPASGANAVPGFRALGIADLPVASQAEALAGNINTKVMTPLRVSEFVTQQITALLGGATALFDTLGEVEVSLSNRVRVDAVQSFSGGEKTQARANIGLVIGTDVLAPFGAQAVNVVFAGPGSGAAAAPTFRSLVAADIPQLAYGSLSGLPTLGTAAVQNIGTSGANVPLLNGENTWSGANVFGALSISAGGEVVIDSPVNQQTLTLKGTNATLIVNTTSGNFPGVQFQNAGVFKAQFYHDGTDFHVQSATKVFLDAGGGAVAASFDTGGNFSVPAAVTAASLGLGVSPVTTLHVGAGTNLTSDIPSTIITDPSALIVGKTAENAGSTLEPILTLFRRGVAFSLFPHSASFHLGRASSNGYTRLDLVLGAGATTYTAMSWQYDGGVLSAIFYGNQMMAKVGDGSAMLTLSDMSGNSTTSQGKILFTAGGTDTGNISGMYDAAALSLNFGAGGLSTRHMTILGAGNTGFVGINEVVPDYRLDVNGSFGFNPGASVTPVDNGDVVFEATNNTTFTIKHKGSDGTVRSGTVTLA